MVSVAFLSETVECACGDVKVAVGGREDEDENEGISTLHYQS